MYAIDDDLGKNPDPAPVAEFVELTKGGAKAHKVFARVKGEEKWYLCGEVVEKEGAVEGAARVHKRLILEYACDQYVVLKPNAKNLEVGFSQSELRHSFN